MPRSTTRTRLLTHAGIDYHKKFIVVTIGDADGKPIRTEKIINDRNLIADFFAGYPGAVCAVESCRGYEWFIDFLKELGLTVHLVNPYQVKLIANSRSKTDKVDSRVLMELLAIGYLPTCYQPTPEERRLRERIRWRAHLVRYATRMKVRIHALLDKENIRVDLPSLFSKDGRRLLKQVQLKPGRQELLSEHLSLLEYFEELVSKEDSWVSETVKLSSDAQLLMTIPGVGRLAALIITSELGDITRFKRAAQVAAYVGLVPTIRSSASVRHVGPITKQGSGLMRWILIQCAWQAIRHSSRLRSHFSAVSRRCGRNSAVVSVARKLIQIAYRVLRDKQPFNETLVGSQQAT